MNSFRVPSALAREIGCDELWTAEQVKSTAVLLSAPLLLAVQRYYGSMEFFKDHFGWMFRGSVEDVYAGLYFFFSVFVLMGLIPLIIIRFVFRQSLREYGLRWGDWRRGLVAIVVFLPPIAVLLLLPSSKIEAVRSYYPFVKSIQSNPGNFFLVEALRGLLFYTAWEFFFRGFMQSGLKPAFGVWPSILIQTTPSCLWHIGTPDAEIFGSIVAGIFFGWLAFRTRSIVYGFILHWSFGIILDLFIIYS